MGQRQSPPADYRGNGSSRRKVTPECKKKPSRSAAFVRRLKPAERSSFEFASKGPARASNRLQVEERAWPGSGTTTLVSPLPTGVEAVKAPCELIHCTSNFRSQSNIERSGGRLFRDLEKSPKSKT